MLALQKKLLQQYPQPIHLMHPYVSPLPLFTEEECDDLVRLGYSLKMDYQKTSDEVVDVSRFHTKMTALPLPLENPIYEKIRNIIIRLNEQLWFFHLDDFGEPLKFMEYSEEYNGFAGRHADFGPEGVSKFRKLTVIVQLSDESAYEGGDLYLQFHEKCMPVSRKRGTVIVFPSFLLHSVAPVTKHVRNSLVTFAYGPPFR